MKGCRLYWSDKYSSWMRAWDGGRREERELYYPPYPHFLTPASQARLQRVMSAAYPAEVECDADGMWVKQVYEWRGNAEADALRAELAAAREERKLWQVTVYEVGTVAVRAIFDNREAAYAAAADVEEDEFQWAVVTGFTMNDASALERFMDADEREGNE